MIHILWKELIGALVHSKEYVAHYAIFRFGREFRWAWNRIFAFSFYTTTALQTVAGY